MASADQFAFVVTPYSFEPEHKEGEESSDSSAGECSDGSGEELVGRLVTLDWCKCSYCTTSTLNHPRNVYAAERLLKHQLLRTSTASRFRALFNTMISGQSV